MMILLTGPLSLLSFYLAFLCYRRSYYKHTWVLAAFAMFMLLITLGIVGASYYTWEAMKIEAASL